MCSIRSIDLFLAYAWPQIFPDLQTDYFPSSGLIPLHLILLSGLVVFAGVIAAWPAAGLGIPQALTLSGLLLATSFRDILETMKSHPRLAVAVLVLPVPCSLLGGLISRWAGQRLLRSRLSTRVRGAIRGAIIGLCVGWLWLAIEYASTPHYEHSMTIRFVYWFWVIPTLIVTTGIGLYVGKQWPRVLGVRTSAVKSAGG